MTVDALYEGPKDEFDWPNVDNEFNHPGRPTGLVKASSFDNDGSRHRGMYFAEIGKRAWLLEGEGELIALVQCS
jgi:hypothetical protein